MIFKFRVNKEQGFTIMEAIVALVIFVILLSGILSVTQILNKSTKTARQKTIVSAFASNQLEIVRNMPYSSIGTVNGNPVGSLPDSANPNVFSLEGVGFTSAFEITYIDDPADGTILAGTDSTPNDYKQVRMYLTNTQTGVISQFVTSIAPKNLESLNNAGAIWVKVIDSQGVPVSGAGITMQNTLLDPDLNLNRTSDAQGLWLELALPASVNGYNIVVTKNGYSTDQTYPITIENPNPVKPDATVVNGQVTELTFVIDTLANLTVKTLDTLCQGLPNIGVNISGTKLIGTNPQVLKFNNNYLSDSNGLIPLSNIEWDVYTPTLLANQNYIVYGTSPIQSINVPAGSNVVFTMILGAQDPTKSSLLVIVKDASTGLALEGATVHLQKGGSQPQDYYGTTGGSVWNQLDFSGGSGQANFNPIPPNDATRYFQDDGNIDSNSAPTGLRLKKTSGRYAISGWLESSTYDTGASSNFTTLVWDPTSQDAATTLKFQIASNNDNATWVYKGPDGTANTYYTVSGGSISAVHDGDRYIRFKSYLSTTDDRKTPVLTGIAVNYVSGCYTPGQTIFTDLTAGNNYDLYVTLAGYQDYSVDSLNISGNQILEVLLSQ